MRQTLAQIALVVREYDEAIAWYTRCLGWKLVEDTHLGEGKRWVIIKPPGEKGTGLLLAKAATPDQVAAIGHQTGGRVFLFLHSNDFWRDYNSMKQEGVVFLSEPRKESYGTVVVFSDLYGNKWDLIEKRNVS